MLNLTTPAIILKAAVPATVLIFCACTSGTNSEWNVSVGDSVPAFALESVDGEQVSSDSLQGQPYVLSIFATWCPPCKMELLALEKDVWQPLKDQGISVIAVNYGDEDKDTVSEFVRSNKLTFPVLIDEPGNFRKEAGVSMVPQSLVVGPNGKILELHVGYTDESIVAIADKLKESKE